VEEPFLILWFGTAVIVVRLLVVVRCNLSSIRVSVVLGLVLLVLHGLHFWQNEAIPFFLFRVYELLPIFISSIIPILLRIPFNNSRLVFFLNLFFF